MIPYFTLAIRIHTETNVRLERLEKREREQFGTRIDKDGDMYETHLAFLEWAKEYDTGNVSIRSRAKHDEWQKMLQCELLEIDGENLLSFDMNMIRRKIR